MDYLEDSIRQLKEQNDLLISEVEELKHQNKTLISSNKELQKALTIRTYTCSCLRKSEGEEKLDLFQYGNDAKEQTCASNASFLGRPAVSSKVLLQKGHSASLAQSLTKTASLKLWKIFLLYLLSQKCWKISKEKHSLMTLKNWQQVCWKKLNQMDLEGQANQFLDR